MLVHLLSSRHVHTALLEARGWRDKLGLLSALAELIAYLGTPRSFHQCWADLSLVCGRAGLRAVGLRGRESPACDDVTMLE
jgi:hypothetical protein